MPVNHHSGGGTPDFGPYPPASMAMFMLEVTWWGHRALWHLLFSGVFERHPDLHFVNTETGTAWLLDELPRLDSFYERMKYGHGSEVFFGREATKDMSLKPSEYWRRQCHVGASFLRPTEVILRHEVGDREHHVGRRLPAHRGVAAVHAHPSAAHVRGPAHRRGREDGVAQRGQALQASTSTKLRPLAEQYCPTKAEIAEPIAWADVPEEAKECPGLHAENQLELV